MSYHGKKVLVTGAGGFIGSRLCEKLVEAGAEVSALVRYGSSNGCGWLDDSSVRRDIRIFHGDVCDRDSIAGGMKGVETVFHLAALISIPYSGAAPGSFIRVNTEGTLNVVSAASHAGVSRVVHTSTSEVYGSAQSVPISEAHPLCAHSPYAASKIGADQMALAMGRALGIGVAVVRPFNTFGPRQSARAIIPSVIMQALEGYQVRVGNLHPTRDMSFIDDTVEGFLAVGLSPAAVGRTINLGSGREIAIGDLVMRILKLSGREVSVKKEASRARTKEVEVDRLVADNTLARELLGWAPRFSLDEGLRLTLAWFEAHLAKYRARYLSGAC